LLASDVEGEIPNEVKTAGKLKQWMNSIEYMNTKKHFLNLHRSGFEQNNTVDIILLGEDDLYYFLEVCIIMQKMFKLTIGDLTLRPRHDMTFYTLFHCNSVECYMMQVVWNRETKADKQKYMKNIYSDSNLDGDMYYKYVKEGSKEDDDDTFVGLMFFIYRSGVGSAPHIIDGLFPFPIHQ
jgi:hypothetical protein